MFSEVGEKAMLASGKADGRGAVRHRLDDGGSVVVFDFLIHDREIGVGQDESVRDYSHCPLDCGILLVASNQHHAAHTAEKCRQVVEIVLLCVRSRAVLINRALNPNEMTHFITFYRYLTQFKAIRIIGMYPGGRDENQEGQSLLDGKEPGGPLAQGVSLRDRHRSRASPRASSGNDTSPRVA